MNGSVFGLTRADIDRVAFLTMDSVTLLKMRMDALASLMGLSAAAAVIVNPPETDHNMVDRSAAIRYMVSGNLS